MALQEGVRRWLGVPWQESGGGQETPGRRRLVYPCLKGLLHLLELLDGQVDRQVKDVEGQTVQQLEGVIEAWTMEC